MIFNNGQPQVRNFEISWEWCRSTEKLINQSLNPFDGTQEKRPETTPGLPRFRVVSEKGVGRYLEEHQDLDPQGTRDLRAGIDPAAQSHRRQV